MVDAPNVPVQNNVPDPNQVVDSIVSQYSWDTQSLTFGFQPSDIDGNNVNDFDEGNWKPFYRDIFKGISEFSKLSFKEVPADQATLDQILVSGGGGQSSDPYPGLTQTHTQLGIAGPAAGATDIVFAGQYSNVWLHEIGHSLGLRHTHEIPNEIDDGVSTSGDDLGAHFLNSGLYSVESYTSTIWGEDNPWTPAVDPGQTLLHADLSTYSPIDMAAIQSMYGANTDSNSGDSLYTFGDDIATNKGYRTIWDTGGNDTIQYTGTSRSEIDLQAATLQKEIGGGGFLSTSETLTGGFLIADGVTVENAIGGSNHDIIKGNAGDNTLTGLGGNDTLTGNGGHNVFKDTAADHGGDTITDFNQNDTIRITDAALTNLTFAYDATTGVLSYADGGAPYSMKLPTGLSGRFVATAAPGGGVDLTLSPTPIASVSLDDKVSFVGGRTFALTGHAASTAGVANVVISATVGGKPKVLGQATLAPDGSFSFSDPVTDRQSGFVATLTDATGAQVNATLDTIALSPQTSQGRATVRLDSFDSRHKALSSTTYGAYGPSGVKVLAADQEFHSSGFDQFDNNKQSGTKFVFDKGFVFDTVQNLVLGGSHHDTLSLSGTDFNNSLATVLQNSFTFGGATYIHDPKSGDLLALGAVTTQDLKSHPQSIVFHP